MKKMYEALVNYDAQPPKGVTFEGILSHVHEGDFEGEKLPKTWEACKVELRSALLELGVQVGLRNDGFSVEETTLLQEIGYGNKDLGDVRKFLNRLLGLPAKTQNVFFAYFYEILDCEIKLAKAEGKYTEGVSDLGGSSIRIDDESSVILKDPYHGQTLISTKVFIDRGISYDPQRAEILDNNKRPRT